MKNKSFISGGRLILPVRLYHTLSSLLTLAVACAISGILVALWGARTDISLHAALIACGVLTIIIG